MNGGPFDRGLVSQAILNGVTIVTPDAARKAVGPVSAPALMRAHPRLVRRPVIEFGGRALIGFDEAARARPRRPARIDAGPRLGGLRTNAPRGGSRLPFGQDGSGR